MRESLIIIYQEFRLSAQSSYIENDLNRYFLSYKIENY